MKTGKVVPIGTEELRAKVRAEVKGAGLAQSRAAVEIGVSDSAFSQWLSGKYPGDSAAIETKVLRWIEARAERAELAQRLPEAPQFVDIPTSRRIRAALSYAQMAGDVALVHGGAGISKTTTAQQYAATHNNVWVATMTASTATLGACLERVATTCGVRVTTGRVARIEADLVDRIDNSRGLLIIDEAQHLSTRAIEALRAIHDATGVGLALLGNDQVYSRITGGRRSAEFAQLFSRIGKRVRLQLPSRADVDALLAAWAIEGPAERDAVLQISRKPGGLRGVTKTLRMASMVASADGSEVNSGHIKAAWADLSGE